MEEACFHRDENPFTSVKKDSWFYCVFKGGAWSTESWGGSQGWGVQVEMEVMARVLQIPPSFPVPLSQPTLPRTPHWWHPRLSHKISAQSLTVHYTQPLFPPQGYWLSWREKIHLHTCFEKSGRHSRLRDGFFCPLKPPPTLRVPQPGLSLPLLDPQAHHTYKHGATKHSPRAPAAHSFPSWETQRK